MSVRCSAVLCAVMFLVIPGTLAAQQTAGLPVSVEVRGGVGVPIGDFADAEAEPGPGVGGNVVFHATDVLGVYGGYSRTWFSCGECQDVGLDDRIVDSGFELGARAALPFQAARLQPWAQAGVLLRQLTFSGFGESLSSQSAVGYTIGGGVSVGVMRSLMLSPGVHFRSYPAEFELRDFDRSLDVTHVVVDVGLSYRL